MVPDHESVARLAQMLASHDRITFFCGGRRAGAERKVVRLAARVKAPIAYTWRGGAILSMTTPWA